MIFHSYVSHHLSRGWPIISGPLRGPCRAMAARGVPWFAVERQRQLTSIYGLLVGQVGWTMGFYDFPIPNGQPKAFPSLRETLFFWFRCLCLRQNLMPILSQHGTWHGNDWLWESRCNNIGTALSLSKDRIRFKASCNFPGRPSGLAVIVFPEPLVPY